MSSKKEKKTLDVFSSDEGSDSEDINQLHVNKQFKEEYALSNDADWIDSKKESKNRSWPKPEKWALIWMAMMKSHRKKTKGKVWRIIVMFVVNA